MKMLYIFFIMKIYNIESYFIQNQNKPKLSFYTNEEYDIR